MTRAEAMALASIHYIPLPDDINGAVRQLDNGKYIIAINSTLSAEKQAEALDHELWHIRLDHFSSTADLETIEAEADSMAASESPA